METLGSTSAINSDKTGTLTMNQMTAVELVDAENRYTISGIGYGLDGKVHHAAGTTVSSDDAILPYFIASDAKLVNEKVVGDPTEGALLVLAHKAGLDIEASRDALPRPGHAAVRPDLQADGDVQLGDRLVRQERGALLRQGRGSGGARPRRDGSHRGLERGRGTTP